MRIINIEIINDAPIAVYKEMSFYPVYVTWKKWYSKKLEYRRYNPTKLLQGFDEEYTFLVYSTLNQGECSYELTKTINLFMQQQQHNIEKHLRGPQAPCITEGNRYFGCTALQNEKGWK